ncbi:MAG TPA: PilZ domain-containing protein [Candidatus Acidoferrum sp.]|nr:PilZ domain-containing protein [Candidatus Acidoferrum sp.]
MSALALALAAPCNHSFNENNRSQIRPIRHTISPAGRIPPEAEMVEQERRLTPRYSFIASAEVADEQSGAGIAARVSELSMNGCYLDMVNPLPMRTNVLIHISSGADLFRAKGRIVYVHPGIGAGVIFVEVPLSSQSVLQRWLATAENDQETLIG